MIKAGGHSRVYQVRKGNRYPPDLAVGANLPTRVIVLLDLPTEEIRTVVEEIASAHLKTLKCNLVFVTSSDDLMIFREHRFPYEFVMSSTDWSRFNQSQSWAAYVEQRLSVILDMYQPDHVLGLGVWGHPARACGSAITSLLALETFKTRTDSAFFAEEEGHRAESRSAGDVALQDFDETVTHTSREKRRTTEAIGSAQPVTGQARPIVEGDGINRNEATRIRLEDMGPGEPTSQRLGARSSSMRRTDGSPPAQ